MAEALQTVNIGLMGLGVVGSGVARTLLGKADTFARELGLRLNLRRVLEKDLYKVQPLNLDPSIVTDNPELLLGDDTIGIVIEVLGGEHPAYEFIREALARGRYVVTANKEVMAKHGPELLAIASENGVDILFEASVGSGTPIIAPIRRNLLANDISSVRAIINGTTNYILSRMASEGLDFQEVLQQAQKLGYAEANPVNDIEGIDAAYKISILGSLAFHSRVHPDDVYREGITRLSSRDFRYARELGYVIKLLALAKHDDHGIQVRVHPVLLPEDEPLAKVDGVLNAVEVEGDLLGRVLFEGPGAGSLPTASAIVADAIEAAQRIVAGAGHIPSHPWQESASLPIKPVTELTTRYYIRMNVADRPGVLAQIAKILGDNDISIASVIQKEANESQQTAEIVIMTHRAREEAVRRAMDQVAHLEIVAEIGNFIRVES